MKPGQGVPLKISPSLLNPQFPIPNPLNHHHDGSHRKRPKSAKKHFSTNFDKRPRILAFQTKCRTSAGTFALNLRKVASRLFDRKSGRNGAGIGAWGWEGMEMKRGAREKNWKRRKLKIPGFSDNFW